MEHEKYMREALACAEQGVGHVNPNPLVGAVIVRDGAVIASGYHEKYGGPHAERNALRACTVPLADATMYVTLEPCSHYGKTPPCAEALIASGIRRVVVAAADPNPLVAGQGIAMLQAAGIEVVCGVCEQEAREQNRVFFHYIQTGLPYVVLKYAMTLDGKTATTSGLSRWITGEQARMRVHRDRSRYRAIMVGAATVCADDPLLTARIAGGRNPLRIVCDSHLRTPLDSQLVKTASEIPTIIATCSTDEKAQTAYENQGVKLLHVPEKEGHLDLSPLMYELGREGIDGIMVESGGVLNAALLEAGLVNCVQAYIAPKIFGGAEAPSPVMGAGVKTPRDAYTFTNMKVFSEGEDILVEAEVKHDVHGNS